MAVRPIVVWPDPRLREKTRPITEVTDEIRALYRDLVDTMYAYDGVGIAAIQIGVPLRMFLVDAGVAGIAERGASVDPVAFINPEVLDTSGDKEKAEEGCLSFPGIYVPVDRPRRARLRAIGLDGKTFESEGEGLFARAMLHEHDHLTGKLLVDFVGPLKKRQIKRKLERQVEPSGHVHGENCQHDHDDDQAEHAHGVAAVPVRTS
ncbi:MAG TPA: peptide deformylase [Kofleriaceae bacterium]|nr:peptide deformylase [Kofleriaceae bacterium]